MSVSAPEARGLPSIVPGFAHHDHVCLVHRSAEEQSAAVAAYFVDGLHKGERCIHIADDAKSRVAFDEMARLGVDVPAARESGALVVLDPRETYLRGNDFDPDATVALVVEAVAEANARGHAGARITGDMSWALAEDAARGRLAEYEAKLSRVFPSLRASALCQYDAGRFGARLLLSVIETHPLVLYGGLVCRNSYYVVPDEMPAQGLEERQVARLLQNILAREQTEDAVRELNASLERRVANRTRQLADANAELETFAYTVSHDLRAPLRNIGFYADILVEDYGERLPPGAREHLDHVVSEARRASRLVDDILSLSRPLDHEPPHARVDLSALVQSLTDDLAASDPSRSIVTTTQPGVVVRGDAPLLRVALQNLLANAWKYSAPREDSAVAFGAEPTEEGVRCYVRDNGVGFDMAKAQRLFQPFERLHGSAFEGTGVGLATVRRIVTRHGGRVWAQSAPGEGTTIWFTLPAA